MATVLLVRHGRTTANATGLLAGRTAGIALDSVGKRQAAATAERLGATVLSSEDSDWTRTAHVRDPQGADLTLSQFTPPGG